MKNKAAYVLLKDNDMKVHIKKNFLNLAIFFASLIVMLHFFKGLGASWTQEHRDNRKVYACPDGRSFQNLQKIPSPGA